MIRRMVPFSVAITTILLQLTRFCKFWVALSLYARHEARDWQTCYTGTKGSKFRVTKPLPKRGRGQLSDLFRPHHSDSW